MKSVRPSSAPIVLGRVLLLLLMLLAGDALAASFTGDENDCRANVISLPYNPHANRDPSSSSSSAGPSSDWSPSKVHAFPPVCLADPTALVCCETLSRCYHECLAPKRECDASFAACWKDNKAGAAAEGADKQLDRMTSCTAFLGVQKEVCQCVHDEL